MYLGDYQLGDLVQIPVWCRNSSGTPAEPDAAPIAFVYSGDDQVDVRKLPILDRENVTGFFQFRLSLDAAYDTGYYQVIVRYVISSTEYAATWQFQILAGGNSQGNGIAMYHFRQPAAEYLLLQTNHGTVKLLRNPSVRGL